MSLLSLSTKSVGAPDNAYQWYLHSSGQTLASGLQVALGDGTGTGLFIGTFTIGVCGQYGTSVLGTNATSTRPVNLANGTGNLFPALTATLATDTSNSTVTLTTVSGFAVTLEASATYEFELFLVFKSAATTTSPQFRINGPTSQTNYVWFEITGPPTVTTLATSLTRASLQGTAWGVSYLNATDLPAANTPMLFRVRGICSTTSTTPAANVTLDIASEVASSAITLLAGSTMLFRKLN